MIPQHYIGQEKEINEQIDKMRTFINSEAAKGKRFIPIDGILPELFTHFLNRIVPKNYKVIHVYQEMKSLPVSKLAVEKNSQPQMIMFMCAVLERDKLRFVSPGPSD